MRKSNRPAIREHVEDMVAAKEDQDRTPQTKMPPSSDARLATSSKDPKDLTPLVASDRQRKPLSWPVRATEHSVLKKIVSTNGRVFISAMVFVPVLALLAFAVIWGLWTLLHVEDIANNEPVCGTADCVTHAFKIGHHLDHSKRPCDDFTAFVCSTWERESRKIPTSGVAEDALLDWMVEITDTLERDSLGLRDGSKLQDMYHSCKGRIKGDQNATIQIARTFMAHRGLSWPDESPANVSALEVLIDLAVNWMTPFWVEISLLPATESRPRMIQIDHSALVDTQYRFLRAITDYNERAYLVYWSSFYNAFSSDASGRYNSDQYNRDKNRHATILRYLTQVRGKPVPFVTSVGAMPNSTNWINGLSKVYKLADPISADDKVFITDKRLLNAIDAILSTFPNDELMAHLSWYLAQLTGIISALLTTLVGNEEDASKFFPLMCSTELQLVYHQLLMESTAQEKFPTEEREALDAFLEQMTEETIALVNCSDWLDRGSKDFLIRKAMKTTINIWPNNNTLILYDNFPDNETYFVSFWIEMRRSMQTIPITTEYGRTVRRYGAHAAFPEYNYLLNAIQLSVALLRPPFYYRKGTKAMMYAGIGFLYANLIVRAFDEHGICFGASGYSGASAFPLGTRQAYVRKAFCGTSNSQVVLCAPAERNGTIFPSLPALQIAYSGFKKALALGGDPRLKNLEGYTPEQVFFITLCYTTCSHDMISGITWGCNEFFRNFPPFAEAFNCSLLSGMKPQERCETF